MIELSTGVVFLLSSMYGTSGGLTANATAASSITAQASDNAPKVTVQNRQAVESYLKIEYADTPILVDIARCESEFRQYDQNGNLIRGRVNNDDVGVMQINEKYHADTAAKLGFDLHTI